MTQTKLYLIADKSPVPDGQEPKPGRRRLIEAVSEAAALKHVTSSLFATRRVSKPVEVGALVREGVEIEKAGEPFATRIDADTGMVDVKFASFLSFEPTRPATLAELAKEAPGNWRVDVESGMVQHQPPGAADGEWHDIREATAEEIDAAKAAAAPAEPAGKKK